MPLPILAPPKQTTSGGVLKEIKDSFFGKNPSKVDTSTPAANDSPRPTKVRPIRNNLTSNITPIRRVLSPDSSPLSRNQEANEKAISISQGSSVNPLVPLVENIGNTLIRNG